MENNQNVFCSKMAFMIFVSLALAGGGINSSQTEGATSDVRGEPGGR